MTNALILLAVVGSKVLIEFMTSSVNRRSFIRGLCVGVGLVLASPAFSQTPKVSTNYVLKVTPDRGDALYKQGETVTFTIKLDLDKQPVDGAEVAWVLSKDGIPPITNGKAKLVGGVASVTGKLGEPGFLQCRATFQTPAKASLTALGGAGIDPLQIKPSLPAPNDFDAYWAEQKKKLAAVPVNPRLTTVKSPVQGLECFDLQADCIGAPVSGYFARPAGAKPKSLPIILTVHGAGVRSSSLGGAASWAKLGFLALDINAHGIPNGKPDAFYTALANGELKDYSTRGRESRDTIYFHDMFLRLMRALDFLTSQPEWDGRTLVVHGSSQGGAQTLAAAGLDSRVTFMAAGVPAMCDHTGVMVDRVNGWPKFIRSGTKDKPDPKVLEAVRYYDTMNFVTRSKAGAIVSVGYIDTTCPPTSVYAAYNSIPGKKSIHVDIDSGHTNTPKATEAMRKAILAHVAEMKQASAGK